MTKRTYHIISGILIFLIVIGSIYLIRILTSPADSAPAETIGTLSAGNTLTVTDGSMSAPIPSYNIELNDGNDDNVYIVAEDLPKRSSCFEIINGTALNYDENKKNELVPDVSSDTDIPDGALIRSSSFSLAGKETDCYTTYNIHLISVKAIEERFKDKISFAEPSSAQAVTEETAEPSTTSVSESTTGGSAASIQGNDTTLQTKRDIPNRTESSSAASGKKVIVLDPGHGKSSSLMTEEEKAASGFVKTSKGWGEWRHWKSGTVNVSCEGSGCTGTHGSNGSCWYPMGSGDRDTEPNINLNNALNAKKYLELMGYEVRMTRTTNYENPSFTKRVSYCYPNNDYSQTADAELLVVIHSNATNGSSRGSAYIKASGAYDQKFKNDTNTSYVEKCNAAGEAINNRITTQTSLSKCGNGTISGEPWLIAFCKSPVPVAYMEIGFFDNSSDLSILNSESEKIGQAIAQGVDDYIKSH